MTNVEWLLLRAAHSNLQMMRTLIQASGCHHNEAAHNLEIEIEHALFYGATDERDGTNG